MTENTENFICIGLMTRCAVRFYERYNIRVNQHNPRHPHAILYLFSRLRVWYLSLSTKSTSHKSRHLASGLIVSGWPGRLGKHHRGLDSLSHRVGRSYGNRHFRNLITRNP